MQIFVATTEVQGQRDSDFCFVPAGEPVKLGSECNRDDNIDDVCGCKRALVGVYSSTATTTFKVAEFDGSPEKFEQILIDSYKREGWPTETDNESILELANSFPLGTVFERRGDVIQPRRPQEAEKG